MFLYLYNALYITLSSGKTDFQIIRKSACTDQSTDDQSSTASYSDSDLTQLENTFYSLVDIG